MASRGEQVAENEALFRDINERVVALPERQEASAAEKLMFYCECGDAKCFEHVRLTLAEYQALRANAARFAVAPGHELPDVERVVERHAGYFVVEKDEVFRDIVEATDPRKGADS
jgi:hypothetical protein